MQALSTTRASSHSITGREPRKADILLAATDVFCGKPLPDRTARDQFKEAFYLLIEHADTGERRILARSLAHNAFCPRSVAIYLAMDIASVAAPVLRHSTVLGQLDLLHIIEKCDREHHRAIASRANIGASIVNRLLQNHDANVAAALIENESLLFTPEQEELIEKTMRKSVQDNTAQEQATEPVAEIRIDQGVQGADTEEAFTSAPSTARTAPEQELLAAAQRGARLPVSPAQDEPISKMRRRGLTRIDDATFGVFMTKAAMSGKREDMVLTMKARFALSTETCDAVLADESGDTLCVLMKAADTPVEIAHRIIILSMPEIGRSYENATRSLEMYKRLTHKGCVEAISHWPREEPVPAPVHQTYSADADGIDRARETAVRPSAVDGSGYGGYRDAG